MGSAIVLCTDSDVVSWTQCVKSINTAFRAFHQSRLLVLNYHGVVSDERALNPLWHPNVIGVSQFSRQMETVARFFHPIAPSELDGWRSGTGITTRRAALVTFDDGYRNNLTYAAPVLQRFGIPALITICPGYIGGNRILWPDEIHWNVMHWPERLIPVPFTGEEQPIPVDNAKRLTFANRLRESCKQLSYERLTQYLTTLRKHEMPMPNAEVHSFLSWDEVRVLKQRGFEIGSHTLEHPILTQLRREELVNEIWKSKRIIEEQLGCDSVYFAYPNGGAADISSEIIEEVRRAGYRFAFTVMGGLAERDDDPLLLDRVYVPSGISIGEFERRISGFHNALKHVLKG